MKTEMDNDDIGKLLTKCGEYPEIFNAVGRVLYEDFHIHNSVAVLFTTWAIIKLYVEEVKE